MSDSISFEAPIEESNDESHFKQDAIAVVAATGIALAGSLLVGTMIRKHFENKAEKELWNEATHDLDFHE